MPTIDEARAKLTGPGAPFEIALEEVLGERLPVFARRPRSLRELLAASAERGDLEYIVLGDRRIRYAEHLRLVASVARAFEERYGVRPGDRVAILAANRPEWILSFWATVSLGAIVSSFNGWWTADEIRHALALTEPVLLVGDRKRLARTRELDLSRTAVVEIESQFAALERHAPEAKLPSHPIAEDDPAVILFTSGTTGRSKGAVNTHRGIVGFVQTTFLSGAERALAAAGAGSPPAAPPGQNVTLGSSPLFHLSGLYGTTVLGLASGGKIVLREGRFDPAEVLRAIERERITAFTALGSSGPRVLDHPEFSEFDVSSVRTVGFGGAPASPALQQRMREAFPNARQSLAMGYGSSESVTTITSISGPEYLERPESCGRPIPTVEVEIRDEAGNAVPDGVEGEIHVRSAYVMREYWRDPGATEKSILPGRWLATGDIGRFEDGYLYINSRARDMILRSAENVYPVEIEYRLEAHPDVAEAAVIGVDHPELGQEVKAIVVPVEGADPDPEELARWCAETLAPYKVPSLWELRREPLPRNAAGKVLKNVLRGDEDRTQRD
jgi:acyl-CoA synthetase (AMP-forming)/AMP-acid ligase II